MDFNNTTSLNAFWWIFKKIPPEDIRDLRDVTRYCKKLIHHRTSEQNRIHKILQDANIKLTSVLSNIFGISGRRILEAILNGEKMEILDLQKMVDRRTKASITDIAEALNGRILRHHREMLCFHWDHMTYLDKSINWQPQNKITASQQTVKEL